MEERKKYFRGIQFTNTNAKSAVSLRSLRESRTNHWGNAQPAKVRSRSSFPTHLSNSKAPGGTSPITPARAKTAALSKARTAPKPRQKPTKKRRQKPKKRPKQRAPKEAGEKVF